MTNSTTNSTILASNATVVCNGSTFIGKQIQMTGSTLTTILNGVRYNVRRLHGANDNNTFRVIA